MLWLPDSRWCLCNPNATVTGPGTARERSGASALGGGGSIDVVTRCSEWHRLVFFVLLLKQPNLWSFKPILYIIIPLVLQCTILRSPQGMASSGWKLSRGKSVGVADVPLVYMWRKGGLPLIYQVSKFDMLGRHPLQLLGHCIVLYILEAGTPCTCSALILVHHVVLSKRHSYYLLHLEITQYYTEYFNIKLHGAQAAHPSECGVRFARDQSAPWSSIGKLLQWILFDPIRNHKNYFEICTPDEYFIEVIFALYIHVYTTICLYI